MKFFKDDNRIWYCTKGNHRFGVPDFAYLGLANEGNNIFDLFANLFSYVYNYKAVLRLGDTAQLDESAFLRFREPYEYQDYINNQLGTTLVIEKISAQEINKPRTT